MIATLALNACMLPEPGESYTSTDCGHLAPVTIHGEWVPSSYVEIDHGLCVENERYIIDGLALFNVYDGAPPCDPITLDPPSVTPPVVVEAPVPEPGSAGLVLAGMIAGVIALVRGARKRL